MKKVTNRDLVMAGAIVTLLAGLAAILQPQNLQDFAKLAGIFFVGYVAVVVAMGLSRPRERAKDTFDAPASEGLAHGITNAVVITWLGVIALVAWLAYSTKPTAITAVVLVALALSILGGGFLLSRKWKTGSLLPYGVAAVVSVLAVVGCLVLAMALRGS